MLNSFTATGRLTADPELKKAGDHVNCTFYLAINRDYKNNDGEYPCDFIPCRVWNTSAEYLAKYASKGDYVSVAGRVQIDTFEDKNGDMKYFTYVNVNNVYSLASRKSDSDDKSKGKSKSGRGPRKDW